MIRFKQFLSESKSAPLYHATSYENAISIIKSNTLKPTLSSDINPTYTRRSGRPTNFLTRSLNHAVYYGNEMHDRYTLIIFELDQQKLNQRYKVKPIRNWFGVARNNAPMYKGIPYGNEFEEIVDKPITSFTSYITAIHIYHKTSWIPEEVSDLIKNHPDIKVVKY